MRHHAVLQCTTKIFFKFSVFFFEQSYEKFSGYVNIFNLLNFKKPVKIKKGPSYSKYRTGKQIFPRNDL